MKKSGLFIVGCFLVAQGQAATLYVDINSSNPVSPYSSWTTAATTIQDAVNASADGDTVLVTNGTYLLSSEILVSKAIVVQSVNGADTTIVDGNGTCRGFNLGSSACVVRGFTITNGYFFNQGGGVFCDYSTTPRIENCTVVGNRCGYGGGGIFYGSASNCVIRGNSTRFNGGGGLSGSTANNCVISRNWSGSLGGGMLGGTATNCRIVENHALAEGGGGGVYNGALNNCVVSGNISDSVGGGMARGSATNCTFTGNTAAQKYGGIEYGKIYNCILFNNQPADTYYPTAYNSCAPGVLHGSNGNITNNPVLVSSSHIATNSPCVGMGSSLYASGTDIDGDAWANPPSMGCDEKQVGETPTGEITLSLIGPTSVVKDYSATYFILVLGNVSGFSVDFGNGTVSTNTFWVDTSWPTAGSYDVVVSAWNDDYPAGISITQTVAVANAEDVVVYVSKTGSDSNDGSSWTQAKATIQAGIDAQNYEGGIVRVGDGHYIPSATVVIKKNIALQSLNGADSTLIDGNDAHSCLNLGGSRCTVSGFTITNGYGGDYLYFGGGGVYCFNTTPVIEDCIIINNRTYSTYNGGGLLAGTAIRCLITGNTAKSGGGMMMGIAENCTIVQNTAKQYGGGMYDGTANNCVITGNHAGDGGGGMMYGTANNCTFTQNTTDGVGGGIWSGTANNCILFDNLPENTYSVAGFNSCAPELTHGVDGNITNNPLLVSSSHIAMDSPCRGAGNSAYASGTDIDGSAWLNPPSMGCDEKQIGETPSGDISLSLNGSSAVICDYPNLYAIQVVGNVSGFSVDFDNGTLASNQSWVASQWAAAGSYDVVVSACNDDHPAGVSITQTVVVVDAEDVVVYVSKTGNDSNDGSSWAQAKATIQAGIDAQGYEGGAIRVGDGHYTPSTTLSIEKDVVLQSQNGASSTTIDGNGTHTCLSLKANGCIVDGFTITNGYNSGYGGGINCDYNKTPVIENCILVGNRSGYAGGGISYGIANNCTFTNNTAVQYGGGSYNGVLNNCFVVGNSAGHDGGGAYGCMLANCLVSGNSATNWAGGVYGGSLTNCTVVGNSSEAHFGGVYQPDIYNSIIWGNTTPGNYPNGSLHSAYFSCTTPLPGGTGNVAADPLFVSGTDFHLTEGSPCIDAGNNGYMPSAQDLDGLPRPLDGDGNGTPTADMGCYEAVTGNDTDGDTMGDSSELIAGTDPLDPADYFHVESMSGQLPMTLYFQSLEDRQYQLLGCSNLIDGFWFPVPGAGLRLGVGGTDSMSDTNQLPAARFYRLEVSRP